MTGLKNCHLASGESAQTSMADSSAPATKRMANATETGAGACFQVRCPNRNPLTAWLYRW